uniref:Uncharacterized protein LOC114338516 n=1 Tax=Diabrotica virgifera virgifera TaxID=50390 RepID=A0A6P7GIB6_DIAVI
MDQVQIHTSLSACAVQICKKYFDHSLFRSTIVAFENYTQVSQFQHILTEALFKYEGSAFYLLKLSDEFLVDKHTQRDFKHIIIEMNSLQELTISIKKLKKLYSWDTKANFLILSHQSFNKTNEKADEIFNILWGEDINKAVIILLNAHANFSFNVYSRSPFVSQTGQSPVSDTCTGGVFRKGRKLYHNFFPTRKSDWAVRVRYFPWPPYAIVSDKNNTLNSKCPGFEVDLLNSLSEYSNVDISFEPTGINQPRGDCWSNGTLTREFQDLFEKQYDILIGSYAVSYERMLYFSTSFPTHEESLIWCVPNKHVFVYSNTVNSGVLGLVVLTSIALAVLTWLVNRRRSRKTKYRRSFGDIVYAAFSIFLGIGIPRLPKTPMLRFLLGLMILFAFLSSVMFTSNITSSLIGTPAQQKYGSMKEIYKHNLTTYFAVNSIKFFMDEYIDGVPLKEIKSKHIDCNNISECLRYVESGNSSLTVARGIVDYILNVEHIDKNKIYCFPYVNAMSIVLIYRKGFLLTNKYNSLISMYHAFGLIDKMIKNILATREEDPHTFRATRLKLTDLT